MVKVFPRSAPVFGKSVTELKSIISIQYLFFFFQSFFELKVWNSPTDSYSCIQMYSSLVLATCNIGGKLVCLHWHFLFLLCLQCGFVRFLPSFSVVLYPSSLLFIWANRMCGKKGNFFVPICVATCCSPAVDMLQESPVPLCKDSYQHAVSWNPALIFSSFWYSVVCKNFV